MSYLPIQLGVTSPVVYSSRPCTVATTHVMATACNVIVSPAAYTGWPWPAMPTTCSVPTVYSSTCMSGMYSFGSVHETSWGAPMAAPLFMDPLPATEATVPPTTAEKVMAVDAQAAPAADVDASAYTARDLETKQEELVKVMGALDQVAATFQLVTDEAQTLAGQLKSIKSGESGGDPALCAQLQRAQEQVTMLKAQLAAEEASEAN
uniref:Uncharacterized protein n=1 Tax=Eutreptiella gymnastica TaxID=73025 RepID=A0A7S1HVA6_9EUGL